jgi:hypothetical protein
MLSPLTSAFSIVAVGLRLLSGVRLQAGVDFVDPSLGGGFMLDNGTVN